MKKRTIWILVILAGLAAMFYINRKAKAAEVTSGGGGGVGGAGGSGPLPTGSRPGSVLRPGTGRAYYPVSDSNVELGQAPTMMPEEETDPVRSPGSINKRRRKTR